VDSRITSQIPADTGRVPQGGSANRRKTQVRSFVGKLDEFEVAVWLDELALPNYRPRKNADLLGLLLKQGLAQSSVVVAVKTEHYGCQSKGSRRNWTKEEWQSKPRRNRAVLSVGAKRNDASKQSGGPYVDLNSTTLQLTGTPAHAAESLISKAGSLEVDSS